MLQGVSWKLWYLSPLTSLCWKHLLNSVALNTLVSHTKWAQNLSWSFKLEKVRWVKKRKKEVTSWFSMVISNWLWPWSTASVVSLSWDRLSYDFITYIWKRKYKMSYWYLYIVYWTNKNLGELSQIKYTVAISLIYFLWFFFFFEKNGNY